MKRLIRLAHHLDDYECMWNGIEDLYIRDSGETIPPNFFFVLSGFGSFCYLRTDKSELKRMVAIGDGRTKKMYQFLAPIAGFEYRHYSYRSFEQAIKKARAEINAGFPVVLGALDMYYLSYYPKLYHKEHIPFHYVLMAGYDDASREISLYDCGREELLTIPYGELKLAWDCEYPGLSKPNTLCTVRLNTVKEKIQIAGDAFLKKGELFLNPPARFLGRKGFEKFIGELPGWKSELSKTEYDKIFANMVTFFGTAPTVPNALRGVSEPDEIEFNGGFDKISRVLSELGREYENKAWLEASLCFYGGSAVISEITEVIVAYLTGNADRMDRLPGLFTEVMEIMTRGYRLTCGGCCGAGVHGRMPDLKRL